MTRKEELKESLREAREKVAVLELELWLEEMKENESSVQQNKKA